MEKLGKKDYLSKERVKVSSRVIPNCIVFPSEYACILGSSKVSDFRQGGSGQGWGAGQGWTGLCAGLVHSWKERC
eukprot:11348087-Ditylum_brightwellii.AAC.1